MGERIYTLVAPLSVVVSKGGKKFALNLNIYRNADFHTLNKAKVVFKEVMAKQVAALPSITGQLVIRYFLYPKTKRLCDVANVCSIVDKFFSDALVELGKISDDNYTIVPGVSYEFGSVDPANPRVEIQITLL